jgi:hypothetical protein
MEAPFRSLVIGVFNTAAEAEHCVEDLRRAGFAADEIGIIEPDAEATTRSPAEETTAESGRFSGVRRLGAAGAIIGGLLGVVTALVIPGIGPVIAGGVFSTALGGAALGFTVVLAGFGMTERQATFYERQLEQGKTVVTVNVAGRYQETTEIFRAAGAHSIDATGVGTRQYATPGSTTQQSARHPEPGAE